MSSRQVRVKRDRNPWPNKSAFSLELPLNDHVVGAELTVRKDSSIVARLKECYFVAGSLTDMMVHLS